MKKKEPEIDKLIKACEGGLETLSEPRRKLIVFLKHVLERKDDDC